MTKMITLGAAEYPVAPLSLSQMRQVGPCFSRMGIDTMDGMAAQMTIIFQGMKAADPAVTMEFVDGITGVTFEQIRVAVQEIGVFCGLEFKKPAAEGAAPGEAVPDPNPA